MKYNFGQMFENRAISHSSLDQKLLFVFETPLGLFCCFIQTWCINNDWKCDFWHLRCLFYQVESILFHFQQLEFFVFQKFPWNTAKMVKNLQCLKTPQICYLRHAEHYAKNRTSLRGLDHDTLFFVWPVNKELILTFFPLIITLWKTKNPKNNPGSNYLQRR